MNGGDADSGTTRQTSEAAKSASAPAMASDASTRRRGHASTAMPAIAHKRMRLCAATSTAQNSSCSARQRPSERSANRPPSAIIDSIAGDSVAPTGRGSAIHM
jgi:hypothetical protein